MTDQRILATEEMVGLWHATKADTINRIAVVEHNNDGTHRNVTTLPWLIDIDVMGTAGSHTNWNTLQVNTDCVNCGYKQSSGAQNDAIAWPVTLAAGTWTVSLIHVTTATAGIYTVRFHGVSKGTIDGYSNPSVYNVISTIAGIVVPMTAKITLDLIMATKNASSGNYFGNIIHLRLLRTS